MDNVTKNSGEITKKSSVGGAETSKQPFVTKGDSQVGRAVIPPEALERKSLKDFVMEVGLSGATIALVHGLGSFDALRTFQAFALDQLSKVAEFSAGRLLTMFFQFVSLFKEFIITPISGSQIVVHYLKPLVEGIGSQVSSMDLGTAKEGIMQAWGAASIYLSNPITLAIGVVVAVAVVAIVCAAIKYVNEPAKELSNASAQPNSRLVDYDAMLEELKELPNMEQKRLENALLTFASLVQDERVSPAMGNLIAVAVIKELPKLKGSSLENALLTFASLGKKDKLTGDLMGDRVAYAVLNIFPQLEGDSLEIALITFSSLAENRFEIRVSPEMAERIAPAVVKKLPQLEGDSSKTALYTLANLVKCQLVSSETGNSIAGAVLDKLSQFKGGSLENAFLTLSHLAAQRLIDQKTGNRMTDEIIAKLPSEGRDLELAYNTLWCLQTFGQVSEDRVARITGYLKV